MTIKGQRFPILYEFVKTDVFLDNMKWDLSIILKKSLLSHYKKWFNSVKPKAKLHIDYITEPIRKCFDDDPNVALKLWELRDEVPNGTGIMLIGDGLQYVYDIKNNTEKGEVNFTVMVINQGNMHGFTSGLYYHKSGIEVHMDVLPSFDVHNGSTGFNLTFHLQLAVTYLLFKRYAKPQTTFINSKVNRVGKLNGKEYQNKEFPFNINVMDSNFFRTIIRTEGFGVNGHLRLQPCGVGRKDRELIWIDSFQKKGYKRISKIEKNQK